MPARGNASGGFVRVRVPPCKCGGILRPFRAGRLVDSETQGVAPGLECYVAFSAGIIKGAQIRIHEFGGWRLMRCLSFADVPRPARGGSCGPRLQTRGFSSQLEIKPSPLKRRATTSVPSGGRKRWHHAGCQKSHMSFRECPYFLDCLGASQRVAGRRVQCRRVCSRSSE
jgi:hypothetical protein